MDLDLDDLDAADIEKVKSLNSAVLERVDTDGFRERMEELRERCNNRTEFDREKEKVLGAKLAPVLEEFGAEAAWWYDRCEVFKQDDEEIAEQIRLFEVITCFGLLGPLELEKGDCVEVSGLESETGRRVNGQSGVIETFIEEKGRYAVRLGPNNVMNLKPDNITKLTDRARVLRFQEKALEKITDNKGAFDGLRATCPDLGAYERAKWEKFAKLMAADCEGLGMDLEWALGASTRLAEGGDEKVAQRGKEIEAALAYGNLGPSNLEKNELIEIAKLESESGKPLNGQLAVVTKWVDDKGRYEVKVANLEEKILTLKPDNISKPSDNAKIRAFQKHLVAHLGAEATKKTLNKYREKCDNLMTWNKTMARALPEIVAPAFARFAVDVAWQGAMLNTYKEDIVIRGTVKQFEDLTSFGTIGPEGWEKGTYFEVFGLTSETGKAMNGMSVILRSWDEAKGRYNLTPEDKPGETKALKADNLRQIKEKWFDSPEEAMAFQRDLQEAYESPEAKTAMAALRSAHSDRGKYLAALRPALLEFQKPALEKAGFRPDHAGQFQMQKALARFEGDPGIAQKNRDLERSIGLAENELRFDGRVAVVTGGGRGLGRAYCHALAERGAKVVVNNRTRERADQVVQEITAKGGVAVADYSDIKVEADKVVATALGAFGRLDIVVANAGELEDRRIFNQSDEEFMNVMNSHVFGHFKLLKTAWVEFVNQRYGRIVVIASEAGMYGHYGQVSYAAAKGALVGIGQTLAHEGWEDGILSNVICTEGMTRMHNDLKPEDKRLSQKELDDMPQPAAIPVAYLCHEACKSTGRIFRVEGGHVQAFRMQTDEGFVDFDPASGGALESVAAQWTQTPAWERTSYRGDGAMLHGLRRGPRGGGVAPGVRNPWQF